jgi:hypothetical protein
VTKAHVPGPFFWVFFFEGGGGGALSKSPGGGIHVSGGGIHVSGGGKLENFAKEGRANLSKSGGVRGSAEGAGKGGGGFPSVAFSSLADTRLSRAGGGAETALPSPLAPGFPLRMGEGDA